MAANTSRGLYCFKIRGAVHHSATSALVKESRDGQEATRRFGQMFIYESDEAVSSQMGAPENEGCQESIMAMIDRTLREVNPYVENYKRLYEAVKNEEMRMRAEGSPLRAWQLVLVRRLQDDRRRYNLPVTNNECMMLIDSKEGDVPEMDLAVHPKNKYGYIQLHAVAFV